MRTVFRIALALVLMVGITSAATAQVTIAIGPKAGVNFADFTGDDAEGIDMRTSFAFGAAADITISDMFSIMPEAYYSMQGAEEDPVTWELDYIRVPILVKLTIPTEGNISPYVFAGPDLGFKARCKISNSETIDCDDVPDSEVKSFDYGITGGAGVGFALGSGMLNINARYSLGLADVVDFAGEALDIKTTNIHVAVAYLFTLGQ
ncbi:MAG: PorT family protein [Gemmatimonadota bacterium]|nr:MAG: PorT family protein [Gemmatimonadota bacterium]